MGRDDSPLRDRVIFIEGAPRSGTTWLVTLLATHPEIAGTQAESHLFDYGVDRLFDNLEFRHPTLHGLDRYLTREQLIDLVRDLCDGVLDAMRGHVSEGARYVVKTPVGARRDGLELERKRDCYPDAWYIHVVREREAVARSLARAPFMTDRTEAAGGELWDHCVGTIRGAVGGLERYREVPYEQLRADPSGRAASCSNGSGSTLARPCCRQRAPSRRSASPTWALRHRTRHRGCACPGGCSRGRCARARSRRRSGAGWCSPSRRRCVAASPRPWPRSPTPGSSSSTAAPTAISSTEGDAARAALAQLGEEVFNQRYAGEWWAASGGPGEFFTAVSGRPFWTLFFSRIGGDATRVDVALGLTVEDDVIRRVTVVSAGTLAGRPVR